MIISPLDAKIIDSALNIYDEEHTAEKKNFAKNLYIRCSEDCEDFRDLGPTKKHKVFAEILKMSRCDCSLILELSKKV